MDLTVLALRVAVSLAVVLGLVWVLWRQARRRGLGGGGDAQRVTVVSRQSLGRNAGVTVVRVGDEALVLGVTEQSVQLLARTDLAAVSSLAPAATPVSAGSGREATRKTALPTPVRVSIPAPVSANAPTAPAAPAAPADAITVRAVTETAPTARRSTRPLVAAAAPAGKGPLTGSLLSAGTWTQTVEALRERTTRR